MKLPSVKKHSKAYQCYCALCLRSRKFERLIKPLRKTDREWMDALYNHFFEIEAELEMIRAQAVKVQCEKRPKKSNRKGEQ